MPYASASDIKKEFPGTTIPVTSADANAIDEAVLASWIEEAGAEVDSKLAGRYTLPITGTNSLLVIKSIVIAMVAWRFAKATNLKNELPLPAMGAQFGTVPQAPNVSQAKATAFARLMAIAEGRERLIDATEINGITSVQVEEDYGPKFKMDTDAW